MIKLKNIKSIFLDYDGTIHNSIKIYEPAFIKAYEYLVKEGHVPLKKWTTDEIKYWLGFSSKAMWEAFLPEIAMDIKQQASLIIKEEMNVQIEMGNAELYKGSIETLNYLKQKGYKLVFISNCGLYYMEEHTRLFQLENYFDYMICSEQFNFIPKHEILKQTMSQFPHDMVIIGDRMHDIESGKVNNMYTIGCRYGYGTKEELATSDLLIDDISELKHYL